MTKSSKNKRTRDEDQEVRGCVEGFVAAVEEFVIDHRKDLDRWMPIEHPGMVLDDRAKLAEKDKKGDTLALYVEWRKLRTDDLVLDGLPRGKTMLIAFKRVGGKKGPAILTRANLNNWFRFDWQKKYQKFSLCEVPIAEEGRPLYCPRWICAKIQRSRDEKIKRVMTGGKTSGKVPRIAKASNTDWTEDEDDDEGEDEESGSDERSSRKEEKKKKKKKEKKKKEKKKKKKKTRVQEEEEEDSDAKTKAKRSKKKKKKKETRVQEEEEDSDEEEEEEDSDAKTKAKRSKKKKKEESRKDPSEKKEKEKEKEIRGASKERRAEASSDKKRKRVLPPPVSVFGILTNISEFTKKQLGDRIRERITASREMGTSLLEICQPPPAVGKGAKKIARIQECLQVVIDTMRIDKSQRGKLARNAFGGDEIERDETGATGTRDAVPTTADITVAPGDENKPEEPAAKRRKKKMTAGRLFECMDTSRCQLYACGRMQDMSTNPDAVQANVIGECREFPERRNVARTIFSVLYDKGGRYPVTDPPGTTRSAGPDSRRAVNRPEFGKVFLQQSLRSEGKENLCDYLSGVEDADRPFPGFCDVTAEEFERGEKGGGEQAPFGLRVYDLLFPRFWPDAKMSRF